MSTETPQPEWPPGSQYYIAPLYFKEARGSIWYYSETNNEWYASSRTLKEIKAGVDNPGKIIIKIRPVESAPKEVAPVVISKTKICTVCKQEKLRDRFYKREQSPDGRMSRCMECTKAAANEANRLKRMAK